MLSAEEDVAVDLKWFSSSRRCFINIFDDDDNTQPASPGFVSSSPTICFEFDDDKNICLRRVYFGQRIDFSPIRSLSLASEMFLRKADQIMDVNRMLLSQKNMFLPNVFRP